MTASMINIKPTAAMDRAIARCKHHHPRVRIVNLAEHTFQVSGTGGDWYTVRLAFPNHLRLAACDCAAGRKRQLCYHAIAALTVARGIKHARTESRWQAKKRELAAERENAPLIKRRGNAMVIDKCWEV